MTFAFRDAKSDAGCPCPAPVMSQLAVSCVGQHKGPVLEIV